MLPILVGINVTGVCGVGRSVNWGGGVVIGEVFGGGMIFVGVMVVIVRVMMVFAGVMVGFVGLIEIVVGVKRSGGRGAERGVIIFVEMIVVIFIGMVIEWWWSV